MVTRSVRIAADIENPQVCLARGFARFREGTFGRSKRFSGARLEWVSRALLLRVDFAKRNGRLVGQY